MSGLILLELSFKYIGPISELKKKNKWSKLQLKYTSALKWRESLQFYKVFGHFWYFYAKRSI